MAIRCALLTMNVVPLLQVRSAVRALTLNVYSIEDPKVQTFVCSRPASSYFQELAISLVEQCQVPCLPTRPPLHPAPRHDQTWQ